MMRLLGGGEVYGMVDRREEDEYSQNIDHNIKWVSIIMVVVTVMVIVWCYKKE